MLLGAQIDNGNLKTIFPLPRDDGQRQKLIGVVKINKVKLVIKQVHVLKSMYKSAVVIILSVLYMYAFIIQAYIPYATCFTL